MCLEFGEAYGIGDVLGSGEDAHWFWGPECPQGAHSLGLGMHMRVEDVDGPRKNAQQLWGLMGEGVGDTDVSKADAGS